MKKFLILRILGVLAAFVMIGSCKKDSQENLPKLKAMTITDGHLYNNKYEFSYDNGGSLIELRHYVFGSIANTIKYEYSSGLPVKAMVYSTSSGVQPALAAEANFSYESGKLSGVDVQPIKRDAFLLTGRYVFKDWTGGNVTQTPSSEVTQILKRWRVDPVTGNYIIDPLTATQPNVLFQNSYEFDNKINPLHGLPFLKVGTISTGLPYNNVLQSTVSLYLFDFQEFSNAHNKVKEIPVNNNNGLLPTATISYTYNRNGQPVKSVRTTSSGASRLETVYEY